MGVSSRGGPAKSGRISIIWLEKIAGVPKLQMGRKDSVPGTDPAPEGKQPAADHRDNAQSGRLSPKSLGKRPAGSSQLSDDIDHQSLIQQTAASGEGAASLALLQARIRELEAEAAANKVQRSSASSSAGSSSRSLSQGSSSSSFSSSQESLSSVDSEVLAQRILEKIAPSELSEVIMPAFCCIAYCGTLIDVCTI